MPVSPKDSPPQNDFEIEGLSMWVKQKLRPITKEEMPYFKQLNMERKTNSSIITHLESKLKQAEEEKKELMQQLYEV